MTTPPEAQPLSDSQIKASHERLADYPHDTFSNTWIRKALATITHLQERVKELEKAAEDEWQWGYNAARSKST